MTLWRVYYHIIWATKKRLPLISSKIEDDLYGYLKGKTLSLEAVFYAIGGVDDHIHLVVSIPPKLAIAEFVRRLKGSSSHHINQTLLDGDETFRWQRGYGVFSFGSKFMDEVVSYVLNQKRHHQEGSLYSRLEECTNDNDGPESEFARE